MYIYVYMCIYVYMYIYIYMYIYMCVWGVGGCLCVRCASSVHVAM